MFHRLVSSLLTVAFVLAVFVAGTHAHVGEVDHQADCTVCRVAHQSMDTVEGPSVSDQAPWTFFIAARTDAGYLPDHRELFRQAPKASPPFSIS